MKKILLVAISCLLAAAAQAQTQPATTPPSAGALRAAEALFQSMQMEKNISSNLDQMLTTQLAQNPSLKSLEPEVRAFLNKYMSADVLKNDVIQLYAREFTEAELKELNAFYQTPTGQKFVSRQPLLAQQGLALGARRMQEHLPELRESIEKKIRAQAPADKTIK